MNNALIDLMDQLDSGSSAGAAYATTSAFFEGLGFNFVNIGVARMSDGSALGLFSNMSESWLNHYVAEGYHTCDVMFDYALHSDQARICDAVNNFELPSRDKARSDRMLGEVTEVGLRSSLILPRHSKVSDHMIGFNLTSDLETSAFGKLTDAHHKEVWLGAALAQVAIIQDIEEGGYGENWLKMAPDRIRLSSREVEVIKWLSLGLRNDRIAERLGISVATVNFHITSAKKKLGASTREQAVAICLRARLI